jgi:hypothetical protein
VKECLKSAELDPFSLDARRLLIACYFDLGKKQLALEQVNQTVRLHPEQEQYIRELFSRQLQAAGSGP